MNTRKPNQVKAGKRKTPLLIQVSVIAILIAVLLCGCGKKKDEDVQAPSIQNESTQRAEEQSTAASSLEKADNSAHSEDNQEQSHSIVNDNATEDD